MVAQEQLILVGGLGRHRKRHRSDGHVFSQLNVLYPSIPDQCAVTVTVAGPAGPGSEPNWGQRQKASLSPMCLCLLHHQ